MSDSTLSAVLWPAHTLATPYYLVQICPVFPMAGLFQEFHMNDRYRVLSICWARMSGTTVVDSRRKRFVPMRRSLISSRVFSTIGRSSILYSCSHRALLSACSSKRTTPGQLHDGSREWISLDVGYCLKPVSDLTGSTICFLMAAALLIVMILALIFGLNGKIGYRSVRAMSIAF